MEKECTKCGQVKPIEGFYVESRNKSGRMSACKECTNARNKKYREENSDKLAAGKKKYYEANREKVAARKKEYYEENREKIAASGKKWYKANPDKNAAKYAKYIAAKIERTMDWLTDEQYEEIKAIYAEAARLTEKTGVPHEVDHVIPMRGKNVSGLHVPWNLQILTKSENCRKNNVWKFSEVEYGNA